jgi:hypothetical protein
MLLPCYFGDFVAIGQIVQLFRGLTETKSLIIKLIVLH